MRIDVLFEDDILLVVNKPSGLLTQPSVDKKRPDLYSILSKNYSYLALHHRLDVGTSGVLVFCKNKSFNQEVATLFRDRLAQKKYQAVCFNSRQKKVPETWTVENYLGPKKEKVNNRTMYASVRSGGDPAQTIFKKLIQKGELIVVEAKPITGRTHQIRVHLFEHGLPILGDDLYTKRGVPVAPRLLLHAREIEIHHPKSGEKLIFTAPLPKEFNF
jgi:23S rRNA pseudouridine955/2504/2580 synthase